MTSESKRAHLAVDDADRVVQRVVGAERIGADELGEALGAVRFGAAQRAHFVQDDGNVGLGDLPSRLAAGEAAADDVNGAHEGLSQSRAASSTAGGAGRRSKRKRPPGEDRRAFRSVGLRPDAADASGGRTRARPNLSQRPLR